MSVKWWGVMEQATVSPQALTCRKQDMSQASEERLGRGRRRKETNSSDSGRGCGVLEDDAKLGKGLMNFVEMREEGLLGVKDANALARTDRDGTQRRPSIFQNQQLLLTRSWSLGTSP